MADASSEPQLQRLIDRVEISELFARYIRCIDERNWIGMQEMYTEDGVIEHGGVAVGRAQLPALCEQIQAGVTRAQHVVSPLSIEIDGDMACLRTSYVATHVGADGSIIRQGGGWYDSVARRTGQGWRFVRVSARSAWRTGAGLTVQTS